MSLTQLVYSGANYRELIDSLDELLYRKTCNAVHKSLADCLLLQIYKPVSDVDIRFCQIIRTCINKI